MTEQDPESVRGEPEPNAGEELEEQDGELLPRREVMSIVDLGGDGGPIYTLPVEPRDQI
jgi:hypothetical protein